MAEAVLFDLWNTLLYCPTRERVERMIKLLDLEGKAGYHEVVSAMEKTVFVDRGYSLEEMLDGLCRENDVACGGEVSEAAEVWRSRLDDAEYFPGAEAVLAGLREDYRLGLISNVDGSGCDYAREKYLKDYFDAVLFSCDIGVVKPNPLIYEAALEELDVKAADAWMVGDSVEADVEGALNAGLKAVLVDRAGSKDARDYPTISNLGEIRGIMERR